MLSVAVSVGATLANGALSLWVQDPQQGGTLFDVFAAAYEIIDATGNVIVSKTVLDVTHAPSTGNRAGCGHYVVAWAPGSATVGQYTIRWFYTYTDPTGLNGDGVLTNNGDGTIIDNVEHTFDQEFELVAVPYVGPHYCAVYDLKAEGLPSNITAAQAQTAIVRASRYVEYFTGRYFDAVYKQMLADGSSARALLLNEPIVAVEKILLSVISSFGASDLSIQNDTLKIFNRHLTINLRDPDDRDNPKLEFVHGDDLGGVNYDFPSQSGYILYELIWPRGRQNVQITGLFGYTEFDGSFIGCTPALIREATKLLVFRNLDPMVVRANMPDPSRVLQETTRDQTVIYSQPWLKGQFTGDWAIDSILVGFVRQPVFGAA